MPTKLAFAAGLAQCSLRLAGFVQLVGQRRLTAEDAALQRKVLLNSK